MATQPPAPAPGNGGNHLGLRIGDRSLSLQSQNLILIVFVVIVGFLSWERGKRTASYVERLQVTQAAMVDALHTGQAKTEQLIQTEIHDLREAVLSSQLHMQQASSEERATLSQTVAAHVQQSQGQLQQCLDLVRQRQVGP